MKRFISVIALATFLTCAAFATVPPNPVAALTLTRSGGGSANMLVSSDPGNGVLSVLTQSCNFKKLNAEDQAKTVVKLTGATEVATRKIFRNNSGVALASLVTLRPMPTGTWLTLNVQMSSGGDAAPKAIAISDPIVLIDGRVSSVLVDVETVARAAAESVCK